MTTHSLPGWLRPTGFAFLYWLVFLLALEPGNILHAQRMGRSLDFELEVLRMTVAALLGCSTAPLLIGLVRRFPFTGERARRNMAAHLTIAAALSVVLILISCVLAAWVLQGQAIPQTDDVRSQLAANWLLLTFVLCAFSVICHVMKFSSSSTPAPATTSIPIKTRGRLGYLDLASIEWIETQGNYLALHTGGRSHLIRETLQNFSKQIDAARFIRVHRRVIVALDQIKEIQPLANGDSNLILADGTTIRASRSYRETLRGRWAEANAQRSPAS